MVWQAWLGTELVTLRYVQDQLVELWFVVELVLVDQKVELEVVRQVNAELAQ